MSIKLSKDADRALTIMFLIENGMPDTRTLEGLLMELFNWSEEYMLSLLKEAEDAGYISHNILDAGIIGDENSF